MKLLIALGFLALASAGTTVSHSRVLCYYDSRSYVRESQARMLPLDLDPALSFCTHLLYGYAGIQPDTYKLVSLNENLDIDRTHDNFRAITNYKTKYPGLKTLLSVGGDGDIEDPEKYNLLLESKEARTAFVNSALLLTEQYGFDGIDLAWQFPRVKPKKIRSTWGSIWHGIKKTFGTTPVDEKESEHREGFTALVRELKQAMIHKPNWQLGITILPNVNATIYHDVPSIINLVDYVNVGAYDYFTPARNSKEADYTAPIYAPQNRNPLQNADAAVSYWLQSGAPSQKIILSIASFGRTWKLDSESEIAGVPPIHADGPGEAGPYLKTEGILSYPEVCGKLINPNQGKGLRPHLRKVTDPSKRFATGGILDEYDWTVWCKLQADQYDCTKGKTYKKYLFYYDLKMEDCKTFYYGDCPETVNKFTTLGDCHGSCREIGTHQIFYNLSANVYCRLQPDFGGCNSYYPMWYYDMSQRACRGFSYSGCGGNKNRFPDSQSCSTTCGSVFQTNSGI